MLDRVSDEMETLLGNQSSNADNQRYLIIHTSTTFDVFKRQTKSPLNKLFAYHILFPSVFLASKTQKWNKKKVEENILKEKISYKTNQTSISQWRKVPKLEVR